MFIFLGIILLFFSIPAWSSAPPNPLVYDTGPLPANLKKMALSQRLPVPKMRRFQISKAPETIGKIKVIVLLIRFTDKAPSHTAAYFNDLIFSGIASMNKYYQETSYDQTFIEGEVGTTWLESSKAMAYYGADSDVAHVDDKYGDIYQLAREAVQKAALDGVDFSPYDSNDADQNIDHLIVVHAGAAQERTGSSNDIWSHHWQIGGVYPQPESVGGGKFALNYVLISEDSPVGIFAHEFAHGLGLPDLYDTSTGKTSVGDWDLMDHGAWLGSPQGSQPAHFSAWSKIQLGWITPEVINQPNTNLTVKPIETDSTNSLYKGNILTADDSSKEYFLFEYRKRTGFDVSLPAEGLLIWHIDDAIGKIEDNNVNVSNPHRRVDLVEADGSDSADTYSGDPYPGSQNITTFSRPSSNAYNGKASGIGLINIRNAGQSLMQTAYFTIAAAAYLSVNSLINYPNPSLDGQVHIRFSLSRYVPNVKLEIFDLAGERVRDISSGEINFDINKSSDRNWVYNYLWNGKNDGGEKVASGIYVYLLEAEGKKRIGKIAIVR
ncbi:MAG: M6 family metalloprotease domain-containing protein [Elusimicrobiota bacterium]